MLRVLPLKAGTGRGRLEKWMRTAIATAVVVAMAGLGAGCGAPKTETGYVPRRLGMNDAQIRGLYASPFSPEAKAAEAEREQQNKNRKPLFGNY